MAVSSHTTIIIENTSKKYWPTRKDARKLGGGGGRKMETMRARERARVKRRQETTGAGSTPMNAKSHGNTFIQRHRNEFHS